MKITLEWLHENHASDTLYRWFENQTETDALRVLDALVNEKHFEWANWIITRLLDKFDAVRYAVFAAEQVIGDYEAKHPGDERPRNAIEAAKRWFAKPTEENRFAARTAAYDVSSVGDMTLYNVAYAACAGSVIAACDAAYYTTLHDAAIWPKLIAYGRTLVERKLAAEGEAK